MHETGGAYISRCNNVVAIIAAEMVTLGEVTVHTMAHDKESVKAEGSVHDNLQWARQLVQATT